MLFGRVAPVAVTCAPLDLSLAAMRSVCTDPVPGDSPVAPVRSYTTQRRYDPRGNKAFEQDGNGHATRWIYDFASRWTSKTDAAGRVQSRTYDKDGNVVVESRVEGNLERLRRETPLYDGLTLDETGKIAADWSTHSLESAGEMVRTDTHTRHPGLSDAALRALAWKFTFDWR